MAYPTRCAVRTRTGPTPATTPTATRSSRRPSAATRTCKPEKANQTTVGVVWEPLNGASLGVDWFYIDLKNIVTNGVPIATILTRRPTATYSGLVTRAATCAGGQPCPITAIAQNFVNVGKEKIQGIDVDARFTSPSTDFGRFRALVTGTYYISYEASQPDGSFAGFVSNAYQAGATGITPRWKSYAALSWDYGPWTATLGNTYQSSYIDVTTDARRQPAPRGRA